ncbi:hypothetical protein F503_07018 [Ophiostoma piceae UAMH 11346]|uniref:PPPDE domain-containing protein n=1 Tax=Ophiostoma piceae (strain UAMH 11346) TaxID=1262450 RepID=S3C8T3_OPHP1|nr:hypothetical protein F503_07018 [Ophiostoma piceae UAMH 11346]
MAPSKPSHKKSHRSHRSTLSLQKTEILINPGRWSSVLWHMGTSLLHSGVVINGKEYAYGGHDRRGVTGVYWTQPRTEPPGGTFRCEILQGFTLATPEEIDAIVRSASEEFLGSSYNLLTKNCNHFTAFLCRKLTGRPGPVWLNRAASIGLALPCVVPREWIDPPAYVSSEGDLLLRNDDANDDDAYHDGDDDDFDDESHSERTGMLRRSSSQHAQHMHLVGQNDSGRSGTSGARRSGDHHPEPFDEGDEEAGQVPAKGKGRPHVVRDSAGNALPPSERVLNV